MRVQLGHASGLRGPGDSQGLLKVGGYLLRQQFDTAAAEQKGRV